MKHSIGQIIYHTDVRLKKWYENAKNDYGVNGYGLAFYNAFEDAIGIYYKEDGEEKIYSVPYFHDEDIDYVFNVWMEQAE